MRSSTATRTTRAGHFLQLQPVMHGVAPVIDLSTGTDAGRAKTLCFPAAQGVDGQAQFKGEVEAAYPSTQ